MRHEFLGTLILSKNNLEFSKDVLPTEIGTSFKLVKFCSSWKIESEALIAVGNTTLGISSTDEV